MKIIMPILCLTALTALTGCQKSVDQQLGEMYAYQKEHDPASAASTAKAYENREYLSDEQKMSLIDSYAEVRKAREAVGQ